MDDGNADRSDSDRIVVGVDGSPSSKAALAWAAGQAKLTGLPLTLVTVWAFPQSWGWSPPCPPDFDPERDATTLLAETINDVLGSGPGVDLETMIVEGHPATVLVQESKSAQLIVVGCCGHGEFAGMLLGSVSEFLTAHSHCPVVVVH